MEKNREELVEKYGRLAVPRIIAGKQTFLGFAENKDTIMEIAGKYKA